MTIMLHLALQSAVHPAVMHILRLRYALNAPLGRKIQTHSLLHLVSGVQLAVHHLVRVHGALLARPVAIQTDGCYKQLLNEQWTVVHFVWWLAGASACLAIVVPVCTQRATDALLDSSHLLPVLLTVSIACLVRSLPEDKLVVQIVQQVLRTQIAMQRLHARDVKQVDLLLMRVLCNVATVQKVTGQTLKQLHASRT